MPQNCEEINVNIIKRKKIDKEKEEGEAFLLHFLP